MATRLEAIQRTADLLRSWPGLFDGPFFQKQISEAILEWLLAARDEGSQIPIEFFREATQDHPDKALSWQGLHFALLLNGDQESDAEEMVSAMAQATDLGSWYLQAIPKGVELRMLGTEPF